MSPLMILLLSFSLGALAALALYRFIQTKNWRPLLAQLLALLLVFAFLRALFDFPTPPPASKGEGQQELYLIIVLYACMLLGMFAQFGYNRFSAPKRKRKAFDLGMFLAPVCTSPIIFILLLVALQNNALISGAIHVDGSATPLDKIEIRGATETVARTVTFAKGQTTEIILRSQHTTPVITKQDESQPFTPQAPPGIVLIPAGSFKMGSEDGDDDEKPIHEVYVDAFFMDETEVTVAQYQLFLNAKPSYPQPSNWEEQQQNPKRPVVNVRWDYSKAYAAWAGKRLPTEAEWEYASRGGNTGLNGKPHYTYPWGNSIDPSQTNYNDEGSDPDLHRYLRDVRSYPQNGYGLYDIAGNVWEWCEDWYDASYYKSSLRAIPKARTKELRGCCVAARGSSIL